MRTAMITRETKETQISAKLDIEGTGKADINTGIGFLDHMIEQIAYHGLFNIELKAQGDLNIDMHHTTEDSAIVLAQTFAKAIGDKKGITRYASALTPMDEALIQIALDISGRPYLHWNVPLKTDKIGSMDCELFAEWFRAFAFNAHITLHIDKIRGENAHHTIEACYKGLAQTLKIASAQDPRRGSQTPSTKGKI